MTQSRLEDRLRQESQQAATEPKVELKSALEKELEAETVGIATQLQMTRAEEIIAQRRANIARLTGQTNGGQDSDTRPGARGKDWLVDVAQGLLERGVDANIVGRMVDYLMGSAGQAPVISMPGASTPGQGITFTDMKELFTMGRESNRSDPALASILDKLTDEVKSLKEKVNNPPTPAQKGFIVVRADGSFSEVEPGKPIVIPPPPPAAATGSSLEELKERNRHEEKVKEIEQKEKHDNALVDVLATIPEKIGEGLAGRAAAGSQVADAPATQTAAGPATETMKCQVETCNTAFSFPQGARKIKCPKCGMVYER